MSPLERWEKSRAFSTNVAIAKKGRDGPADSLHNVMRLENAMHDWDTLTRDPVYGDVAVLIALISGIDEEEEVPAVEGRLHGATECCASL